jgi:hypothetical protein
LEKNKRIITLCLVLFEEENMAPLSGIACALMISVASAKKLLTPGQKDLKHIGCDVCNRMVGELHETAAEARKVAPYNKISEEDIQDMIEETCKADQKGGEWIRALDITSKQSEKGEFLELVAPGGLSKCKEECDTIVNSCTQLLDEDIDADDLSGLLYKNKLSRKELKSKVCREWSGRCSSKAKPINYDRTDIPFEEISEKDLQMEQMMAQMKAAGMGGMNMYNKDDMEGMMANGGMPGGMGGGDYDDYGDMGGMGGMGGYGGGMPGMDGYEGGGEF